MKYMGSKARHAKEMLPIILANRSDGQWYVEPFVGGANMIDKVGGNRIGADINKYLIGMLQSAASGWLPPATFDEANYRPIRDNKENYPQSLVGYVGFALSYSGRFFEGWCRGVKPDGTPRDFVDESYRNAIKQFPLLKDVVFECSSYEGLEIPDNSVIYCDPPYKGTKQYKDKLDHDLFYEWCRQKHKEGHQVFVSEYAMPDDFICVWSKDVNSSLTKETGSKKGVEKLFTLQTKGEPVT